MQPCIQSICLFTFVASLGLSQEAFSQAANTQGIRLIKDEHQRVVAVDYYGSSGLRKARLHEYPHLVGVYIVYGTELSSDEITYLSTLKNVTELWIGGDLSDEYVTIEGGLSKLADMKSLETLFLCKQKMKDEDLEFVASLPRLTYLEFIADTNPLFEEDPVVTDRCADYLVRAKTLRHVCIRFGEKLSDKFVFKVTQGLRDLEHLNLGSPDLTDESLRLLAKRCKKLKWLDIGSNGFTDEGVKHLSHAKNLKMLWLSSSSLTPECVKSVAGLQRLRHLELTVPSIKDEGVQVLANLRQLKILALRQPALTDKQFAMFRNHPTLESAFINGSKLSEAEVVKVIRTLPKLDHLSVAKNKGLQIAVDQALTRKQTSR